MVISWKRRYLPMQAWQIHKTICIKDSFIHFWSALITSLRDFIGSCSDRNVTNTQVSTRANDSVNQVEVINFIQRGLFPKLKEAVTEGEINLFKQMNSNDASETRCLELFIRVRDEEKAQTSPLERTEREENKNKRRDPEESKLGGWIIL